MTRAGVFLTAALAAASLGLFAQDHSNSAVSPSATSSSPAVEQTGTQKATNTAADQPGSHSAQSAPAARDSSHKATTSSTKGAIQSSPTDPERTDGQLPQTSTILPLLGLIGLGSLVAGLFARR